MGKREIAPGFAEHWARQLGASTRSLERLRGGINNRVFRCGDGNQHWVIKGYSPALPCQRDRMKAEVDFLRFAAQAAPGYTPGLIVADPERRCVVLEYLEGEAFSESLPPSKEAVEEAVEFFRQLNANPNLARRLISLKAADGFLSLQEHLCNVRSRLEGMRYGHLGHEIRTQVERLIFYIYIELERIEKKTSKIIQLGLVEDKIDLKQLCVSPSDFGFHNAIATNKGICFFDFEFAGFDDPAKTLVDFILQPRIPVLGDTATLSPALKPNQIRTVQIRCKILKPILRLKWLCIILSILKPQRLEQMLLANPELNSSALAKDRILCAHNYLNATL